MPFLLPLSDERTVELSHPFKHELSDDDFNLFPRFSVEDGLQDDFVSPKHFFRDTSRELYADKDALARRTFAAFLEGMRGPYYVTEDARPGQKLMVKLLHAEDRAEFAAKYPQWQATGMTHNNASFLVRAMLDHFRGISPGMRAVMNALRVAFDRMPHKPHLMTRLEFLDATKIVERGKGAAPEGRSILIHFVNAALLEAFPTPRRETRILRTLPSPHPGRRN